MRWKKNNVEEQLRQGIIDSEMSCYKISKLAGVTESQLSLFLSGKRSLTLASAAKIAEVLGLELRQVKKKGGGKL
jgi:transcriptional regulator with XRE-family HTH domain